MLIERMRKNFANNACMTPNTSCTAAPIRSHTVSKSNYLAAIAEGGHVLQLRPNYWAPEKAKILSFQKVSIHEATTFPGYCSKHDGEMFQCLDIQAFAATSEQLFMQAYRAHARELHCKNAQILSHLTPNEIEAIRGESDSCKSAVSQFSADHLFSSQVGGRDALIHHTRLEAQLALRDFGRLSSCVIPFRSLGSPVAATAGSFLPDFDIMGRTLQDFGDTSIVLNTLHYSILPGANVSYAILSFLDCESAGPRQLIDSIVAARNIGSLLIWTAMLYIENTVLRPSWWLNLQDTHKEAFNCSLLTNVDPLQPMIPLFDMCPADFAAEIKTDRPFWI